MEEIWQVVLLLLEDKTMTEISAALELFEEEHCINSIY